MYRVRWRELIVVCTYICVHEFFKYIIMPTINIVVKRKIHTVIYIIGTSIIINKSDKNNNIISSNKSVYYKLYKFIFNCSSFAHRA